MQSRDSPSGTGPRNCDGEGMTARVSDIISRMLANEPRMRVLRAELTRLVLSSSTSRGVFGRAAFANVCSESCVTALRERLPGNRVRHAQKPSTTRMTSAAVPQRMPPSIHISRLSRTRPRMSGWNASSVPKRLMSQSCRSPPVCERVRA